MVKESRFDDVFESVTYRAFALFPKGAHHFLGEGGRLVAVGARGTFGAA